MPNLGFGPVASGALSGGGGPAPPPPVPSTTIPALSDDAAIFELSYTKGNTGVYHLAGAWSGFFPFSSEFANGATVLYRVTDGSQLGNAANTEIGTATYNASANTLTRVSIIASTNGAAAVNWSGRTRLLVHALTRRLTLCATPPTVGQVLAWDGTEWCPETLPSGLPLCATPPTNGQVLIWDAMTNEWCPADFCALVAACMNPPFSVGAVAFRGQAYLWNFPAMTDSPQGSMSFWIRTETSQIPIPGTYTPDLPNGDIFDLNSGYIIGGPPVTNFDAFFIGQGITHNHVGNDPTLRQVNPITNISSANPAVITFTLPHGVPGGAHFLTTGFNQSGWSGFNGQYLTAASVGSTTITTDFNSTGFPGYNAAAGTTGSPGPNSSSGLEVFNAGAWSFGDSTQVLAFSYDTTNPVPSGVWVNVLASWQTNHASGAKIMNLYYGDTAVAQDGSFPSGAGTNQFDTSATFTIPFSTPSASEVDSWMVGGNATPSEFTNNTNNIVCDMAELWFAPGQYIDFTVAANRQKFHDATSGKPISLGADGSLPTGTKPTLYQSVPASPPDPYAYLGLPVRFVNPQFNGAAFAGSFSASPLLVCSFWIWGGGDHLVVDGNNQIELDAAAGTITIDLFDSTFAKEFNFRFPVPSNADVFNVAFAVDTNHAIGAKLVTARVNNATAAVTVLTDNASSWSIDWTGPMGFVECNGFIADFWLGPGQFFDPLDKFMSAGNAWVDIGTDGSGANGTAPKVYLSVRGTGPASDFATNRGTGGALTQNGPFLLVPDGAVFLKNLTGNGDLLLNSGFTSFALAATSPSM